MVMDIAVKRRGGRRRRQVGRLAALLLGLATSGCDTVAHYYEVKQPFDTPVDWWHQLQGGVIADERPPPPGIDQPFPNFAAIPPKPTPTPAATRNALSAQLAGQRDRTDRLAVQDPVAPVPPPGAPGTAGALTAALAQPTPAPPPASATAPKPATPPASTPPPDTSASAPMASIQAADAPPPLRPPPPPVAPPAPPALQQAAAATPPPPHPAPGAPLPTGPVPPLPTAPPALPVLAGIPAATTAPATPRPAPQVSADFLLGSAVLRPESDAALRQLAALRAGGQVEVLGGGDAPSAAPAAQAAALSLAWRRARAIADVLAAAGTPPAAMHIDAAALARGGIARLVE